MDLNEAMEKAQAQLDAQAEPEAALETTEVVEAAPVVETETPAEAKAAADRARDESGKFTKAKVAAKAKKDPAGTAPSGGVHGAASAAPPAGQGTADGAAAPTSPIVPSAEPASSLKAPSSWKPAAREAFAKAPREVQEEAVRIDREVRQVMQRSAEAQRIATQVQQVIAPLEGIARANGMDGMSFAGEGAKAMAAVYAGAPQAAVQVVANAIATLQQRFGPQVLDALNAQMGQPASQAPQQHQPAPDIDAVVEAKLAARETQRSVSDFLAHPPEFLEYVKDDLPAIIETDRARGGNLTLQQAYDRACKFNEDVQSVLAKRKEAERARTATAATQAAQAATQVSLKGSPAASVRAKPKGIDAALNAAREKLGM